MSDSFVITTGPVVHSAAMRLNAGHKLGPYEIISPLGAGGMGEVYRARDTRLGRDVAVKVVPQHLSENAEVHARFEREARTISSLNHPHICTLHDVGREGDIEYLVMELVDGETLAQRLERGPLPVSEVLRLGIQIADALDRAHRAGIVHRDFKPENVMLTRSGAKLMDFGLARPTAIGGAGAGSDPAMAGRARSALTAEGTMVGTFLYMSPEQLEGRPTDGRSDLWAFGCVLYEMITGRRAFDGQSQASVIGAILHTEPPALAVVAPVTPPPLDALVLACLVKDPDERIQTAHDIKLRLTWIAQSGSHPSIAAPVVLTRRGVSRETIAWVVAGVAIFAAAWFAWRSLGSGPGRAAGEQIRFTIPVPSAIVAIDMPRISPDGRVVAFSAKDSLNRTMIWVRPLNSLTASPLSGTEGARPPFWSPDSRYLAFVASGKLKRIALAGGPATVVCDAPSGSDGSWGREGVILFDGNTDDPIRRVNAAGGVPARAVGGDSTFQVGWPAFLPDGKHYFYTRLGLNGPSEIMLGALGDSTGRPLKITGSRVEYSPDGYLLFARERTLMAQRFNARSMKLEGGPFAVAEDLPVSGIALANFTVSRTGVLVYRPTGQVMNRLVWLDRGGHEVSEVAPAADVRTPALSPDGSRIALRRRDGENFDIWVLDPARHSTTRFTFDPGLDGSPVWSPDGSRIAWSSQQGDNETVSVRPTNGLGKEQILTIAGHFSAVLDWSRDGGYILYQTANTATGMDLYMVPTTGEPKPEVVLQTPFDEYHARFSPDRRWVAYESTESGTAEVYVASVAGMGGKWQVSRQGGTDPCWSRDGRELFYLSPDQQLMAVAVTVGTSFEAGTPGPLFRVQVESGFRRNVYEVSPDGKRFLFLVAAGGTNTPMTVMVNWRAGLERK